MKEIEDEAISHWILSGKEAAFDRIVDNLKEFMPSVDGVREDNANLECLCDEAAADTIQQQAGRIAALEAENNVQAARITDLELDYDNEQTHRAILEASINEMVGYATKLIAHIEWTEQYLQDRKSFKLPLPKAMQA